MSHLPKPDKWESALTMTATKGGPVRFMGHKISLHLFTIIISIIVYNSVLDASSNNDQIIVTNS